jgi:hypothetical protein
MTHEVCYQCGGFGCAHCNYHGHLGQQADPPEFKWRDLGDGKPVKVQVCQMCGVAPSNVDDCGEFGNPECPYFGIGREEYEQRQLTKNSSDSGWKAARG